VFSVHVRALDRSAEDLANRYAVRLMGALEPDAILLTAGDNGYLFRLDLREVEGERPDRPHLWLQLYFNDGITPTSSGALPETAAAWPPSADARRPTWPRRRARTPGDRAKSGRGADLHHARYPPLAARWRLEPAAMLLTREEMTRALERASIRRRRSLSHRGPRGRKRRSGAHGEAAP
jgi:hypothetical protein